MTALSVPYTRTSVPAVPVFNARPVATWRSLLNLALGMVLAAAFALSVTVFIGVVGHGWPVDPTRAGAFYIAAWFSLLAWALYLGPSLQKAEAR